MKTKIIKKKSRPLIWLKQLFNFAYHNYVADETQKKKYFKQRLFNEAEIEKWAKQNKEQVEKAKQLIVNQAKYQKLSAWNRQSIAHRMAYFAAKAAKSHIESQVVNAVSSTKYGSALQKSYKYLNRAVKVAEIGTKIIQTYKKWSGLKQRFDRTAQNYQKAGSMIGKAIKYGSKLVRRLYAQFTGQQYHEPQQNESPQSPQSLIVNQDKNIQQQIQKVQTPIIDLQLEKLRAEQQKIRQLQIQKERINRQKQLARQEQLKKILQQKEAALQKQRQTLGKKRNLRF